MGICAEFMEKRYKFHIEKYMEKVLLLEKSVNLRNNCVAFYANIYKYIPIRNFFIRM